ncbi:MAG: histidine phosphatase family protein, partial [Parachlamydia sp.]|nr:histidine phosphatase family protein [Parachlamydia sp.]
PASEPKVLFYFVRHGETDWNKQNKALGHLDISINTDGFSQAQELKQLLAPLAFDRIVSSDLKRAHDTASIVAEGRGQTILQDRRLRSRDWGELTGKASTLLYITNPELFACVEKSEVMEERIFHFLEEFAAAHPKERVLVVCHGSIMRIIMSKVLGFVLEGVIVVPNTAWLKLSRRKNTWKLEEIKDIQLPMDLRFTR